MKKIIILGIVFLFVGMGFQPAFANNVSINRAEQQPRSVTFYKIIKEGFGEYVQQTSDDGYIIVGEKDACVWLYKTNIFGNMEWDKTLSGSLTDRHWGYCVQQTSDGGYIMVGNCYHYITEEGGVWLVKTNSDGNKLWDRTFGDYKNDEGYFVEQTSDNGFIITGTIDDRVFLIKTDFAGNKEWEKTYGGTCGYCVRQTTDGGYIVTGEKDFKIYLFKTDSSGNKEWEIIIEHSSLTSDGESVQLTNDGGYILTGSYGNDILFVKTDCNGTIEWDKSFGKIAWGRNVQQTSDGGYIIIGGKWLIGSGLKIMLTKTDSSGNKEWDNYLGVSRNTHCQSGQQTSDGGYIILGSNGFDVLLIKTNEFGRSKSKVVTNNNLLIRLLERFPLLQRLLDVWRSFVE
jgi:hypothetical protein